MVWDMSIWEIYHEKAFETFQSEVIAKLTPEQKTALNVLCFDKDTMWDSFRHWTAEKL